MRRHCLPVALALSLLFACLPSSAQTLSHRHAPAMQGMPGMAMDVQTLPGSADFVTAHEASGTSLEPADAPLDMIMSESHGWQLMTMGEAFLVDTQQSGPRGDDKFFSTNWGMFRASRALAGGIFSFRTMLSLEPATVTERRYPLLFQTGETAFGRVIVDAQHPHNFFMELALEYTHPLSARSSVTLYGAPVGDIALGPVAYPHRISSTNFEYAAPLAHHWEDSTHIARSVLTGALSWRDFRWEASAFHGQEPGENRWNLPLPGLDSWASRLSWLPTSSLAAQASVGRLHRPESTAGDDVVRATASLTYVRSLAASPDQDWLAASLIWGRNHFTAPAAHNSNAYTAEATWHFARVHDLFARVERLDNDELFNRGLTIAQALELPEQPAYWINSFTLGYSHEIPTVSYLRSAIGGSLATYFVPAPVRAQYGDHPVGVQVFLRLWLRRPRR